VKRANSGKSRSSYAKCGGFSDLPVAASRACKPLFARSFWDCCAFNELVSIIHVPPASRRLLIPIIVGVSLRSVIRYS
jgi:hypothetical protein